MSEVSCGERAPEADQGSAVPGHDFKNLTTWQVAMKLVEQVYGLTEGFPRHELCGLASQMQRAAVWVPSNIAEGHARDTKPEYLSGLTPARGSVAELEALLIIAARVKYIPADAPTLASLKRCHRLLHVPMGSVRRC